MELNPIFQNRELETRNPSKLLIVDAGLLKKSDPDTRAILEKFYDLRADKELDAGTALAVKTLGAVHTPIFITHVDELELDVVVDGKQRVKAARAAGLSEVPVIQHDNEGKVNVILELSANLARSENTPRESALAFRKGLQAGLTQEELASMAGVTPAAVSYAISIGDMPKIVHKYIESGKLSATAALQIKKACGKKAPKGSGVTAIYDEKEVTTFLENLEQSAATAGGPLGGKIKVKQAAASKAAFAEGLNKKEWQELIKAVDVPEEYKALIKVFINESSIQQARAEAQGELDWLRKIAPQPKPKPVKEPKVKGEKKGKEKDTAPANTSDQDLSALFN